MKTIAELEEFMTRPSEALIRDMKKLDGDIVILGVGGKMGPTLAILAKRAMEAAGLTHRVIGVSRFTSGDLQEKLEHAGIETVAADFLKEEDLAKLPQCPHVIYMAGNKFGTTGNEHFTWVMNSYVPGRIAAHYKDANIVAFSSGNIYPFSHLLSESCTEKTTPEPIGEYAQSTLGRERVLTNFSVTNQTPMLMFRLNYAIDLRYGVLLEIAKQVFNYEPVDLTTGTVNVIWQGDANEYALRSLLHTDSPPTLLNVTGPENLSVRWLAHEFGDRFQIEPKFSGEEQSTALLNNASKCHQLFGYPKVTVHDMLDMIALWVEQGGDTYNKPTHFQERKGAF